MGISGWNRSAGVLLPITMLFGPMGIGVMGREAIQWIDMLKGMGIHGWQILPAEHTDESYSPYKCVSAFAGSPLLIDLRMLRDEGLLTPQDIEERTTGLSDYTVDYEEIERRQISALEKAYDKLAGDYSGSGKYTDANEYWLEDYALYMVLRENYSGKPWYEWPDKGLRDYEKDAVDKAREENAERIGFYKFVQSIFKIQWELLKSYAEDNGVSIIGDMPMYVSEDSADVWSLRGQFKTDGAGNLSAVAGVPPDYFASDGQRWGNPLYNWQAMEKDGYSWWTKRMRASMSRYDVIRMDHFRGFESYYSIPAESETARNGSWIKGPGAGFFKAVEESIGNLPVFAEDLGDVGTEVAELLKDTGYMGMRVLQFGFLGDGCHLPHRYDSDTVAYTGTHDNTTLLAWMYEMDEQTRDRALFYCGYEGQWSKGGANSGIFLSWLRLLYLSRAKLVIAPIQDFLGYGSDTRINIPGTPRGNWRVRITKQALSEIDVEYIRRLIEMSDRGNKVYADDAKPVLEMK